MRGPELEAQILRRAGDLLYAEGVSSTGVDRIAAAVGVSKRTLYQHFAGKDELVAAALEARSSQALAALLAPAEEVRRAGGDALEELRAVFAGLTEMVVLPDFHGCPYLNAVAEQPPPAHRTWQVAREHKKQLRAWLHDTAQRAHLPDPESLARQLLLLLDGALSDAHLADGEEEAHAIADAALTAATALTRPQHQR